MMIAQLIRAGRVGWPSLAALTLGPPLSDGPPFTVVCRWSLDSGAWQPIFGLDAEHQRVELPQCFSLNNEAHQALLQLDTP